MRAAVLREGGFLDGKTACRASLAAGCFGFIPAVSRPAPARQRPVCIPWMHRATTSESSIPSISHPWPDHLPAAFGGKGLILELFIHAFGREVGDTGGPHQGGGHDDAGQLVHGKQALFHGGFGLHVAHQAVAVALDRADIRVGDALRRQQLLHMAAVLLGIFLEVHIVQIADRRPMRGDPRRNAPPWRPWRCLPPGCG